MPCHAACRVALRDIGTIIYSSAQDVYQHHEDWVHDGINISDTRSGQFIMHNVPVYYEGFRKVCAWTHACMRREVGWAARLVLQAAAQGRHAWPPRRTHTAQGKEVIACTVVPLPKAGGASVPCGCVAVSSLHGPHARREW